MEDEPLPLHTPDTDDAGHGHAAHGEAQVDDGEQCL